MTIQYQPQTDRILDTPLRRFVVPVNAVGVMGAGLAKAVKVAHPSVFNAYRNHLRQLHPGEVLPVEVDGVEWLFAVTKLHYSNPTELAWVERCVDQLTRLPGEPVALPWLGCGCGGLKRGDVRALYDAAHWKRPGAEWWVYSA